MIQEGQAMRERVRTTAHSGLRLRNSPHDGETLSVIPEHASLEVLDSETWLRVRTSDGKVGFVLSEHVEPEFPTGVESDQDLTIIQYQAKYGAIESGGIIRIDKGFEPALNEIEKIAHNHHLTLFVTSSLRRPRQAIVNSEFEPASLSNHHVGHAIDMNVIMDGVWYNSSKLGQFNLLPGKIQSFLESINNNASFPLRWGGLFSSPDPIHIDDGFNIHEGSNFRKRLLAIWGSEVPANMA